MRDLPATHTEASDYIRRIVEGGESDRVVGQTPTYLQADTHHLTDPDVQRRDRGIEPLLERQRHLADEQSRYR